MEAVEASAMEKKSRRKRKYALLWMHLKINSILDVFSTNCFIHRLLEGPVAASHGYGAADVSSFISNALSEMKLLIK